MPKPKSKLVLGIDASRSLHASPTGVERYSTEIIRAILSANATSAEPFDIRLYTPALSPHFPADLQRVIPFPRLWTLLRLSWEMLWNKPDVLFVPAHVLPFFAPQRSAVTLHDIAFEKFPKAYGKFQRIYLRWSSRRALKKGSAILVPTQAVKDDLLHFYEADPKKIHVVAHGPLPLSWPEKSTAPENPYFLFVGRLEEKKNLETLISAWEQIHTRFPKLKLLLGGKPGHGYEKIHAAWEASPARSSIELTGYLPEESVAVLMKNAQALVLPSLDEGFGFPVLQAFEAGCPMICSDIPALREVAGEAALFFCTMEAGALAQVMRKILTDAALVQNLKDKGQAQLGKFSWGKAGREVMKILGVGGKNH